MKLNSNNLLIIKNIVCKTKKYLDSIEVSLDELYKDSIRISPDIPEESEKIKSPISYVFPQQNEKQHKMKINKTKSSKKNTFTLSQIQMFLQLTMDKNKNITNVVNIMKKYGVKDAQEMTELANSNFETYNNLLKELEQL